MGTPTVADGTPPGPGIASAVPRWRSEPRHADTPRTEYECPVPADTVRGLGALADRLRVRTESVLLAAHAKVLAGLCGERDVLTGLVAPGGAVPEPCGLLVADGDWQQLVLAAERAMPSSAGPEQHPAASGFEVVLDLSAFSAGSHSASPSVSAAPAARAGADSTADAGLPGDCVLRVAVLPERDGLRLRLLGRGDVLDGPYAERVGGYLLTALAMMTADATAEHHAQSLLSAGELAQQIDGLAGPLRAVPDRRMHELFEERVREHPDHVAAVHDGAEWSYDALNRRANRIAHALLDRGLRPEDVVAVVTERNLSWMAAVLGVFKAGGVYLPVEPNFPADRIAAMLGRSACRFVLTEPGSTATLDQVPADPGTRGVSGEPAPDVEVPKRLYLADVLVEEGEGADTDPGVPVAAGQLAYIYFTSGSTGEPKGAMCEHAGMLNHLLAKIEDLEIGAGQVVAQTAPQCFDISLWQLVSGLLVGARTLVVGQREVLDIERYVEALVDGGVEVLQVVPSYLEVMLTWVEERRRGLGRLRVVSATGEALKKELVERWFAVFPDIGLVNAYGLTETSDDTNHAVMDRVPAHDRVPLGPAVRNVRVYVVDEQLVPVPLGAPGEIVFSGVCVGRGYINDPVRTAAAFGTDPHRPGERLYRSGDIGRWLPDGALEFLGRRDSQTKIRGFRIEIGEIENHLLRVPGVRDSAVVVVEGTDGERHLAAFYAADLPLSVDEVRKVLGGALPAYMVPRIYHHREVLPLTGNGKIDKKVLAREAVEAASRTAEPAAPGGDTAPRTATERRLAEQWSRVLNIPVAEISRGQHFFESGGTSLSAVRLGVESGGTASLEDIVNNPVLAELARVMDEHPQQGKGQSA
ncbi:non-ribosomal peptide synthetase [Streptomyces qinglanensis]|uniref:Non-ribosomal peptide synthetase n=1 Tax=Streptomyces qinglanensis TaxID=943816 RepID=A0A1E7K7L2_9ACTN|nr:amino acid adenylation domain-containing protein [Streptomyces qinglanensis]OEU99924.1 non-ribosomal peptide synthetase [Streptomyces qinglanensis]OEV23009.1 non-ribosomal peptide synthetase [Streptomyces nanshensis]